MNRRNWRWNTAKRRMTCIGSSRGRERKRTSGCERNSGWVQFCRPIWLAVVHVIDAGWPVELLGRFQICSILITVKMCWQSRMLWSMSLVPWSLGTQPEELKSLTQRCAFSTSLFLTVISPHVSDPVFEKSVFVACFPAGSSRRRLLDLSRVNCQVAVVGFHTRSVVSSRYTQLH